MTKKRYRKPSARQNELKAVYGKFEGELDIFYCWNGDSQMSRDCKLISNAFEETKLPFGNSLRKELEIRGYDITTFKFSIKKVTCNG